MVSQPRVSLDNRGFAILKEFCSSAELTKLRDSIRGLEDQEGENAGSEFKREPGCIRLANLANKGKAFLDLIDAPKIMPFVRQVLGDQIKLSSINSRTSLPQNDAQPLHADMGAVPDEMGFWVCNVIWLLDDFTLDNGALRVVPGSHRWNRLPTGNDLTAAHPDEVILTAPAGSVIVINAHVWHAGLANRSSNSRTAIHAFYCRRDKPQQQYQKDLLSQKVQNSLSHEQRILLALDDPMNDELSRNVQRRSGFLE